MAHISGLAYAVKKLGLDCDIYTTTPVYDMGRQLLIDIVKSKLEQDEFHLFTLNDIEIAFDKILRLRYSQPHQLSGNCSGIVITAFNAGHTVGGTVWKIQKDSEHIVYAVDYNHSKEGHLNGSDLMTADALRKPSLMITDSINSLVTQPVKRKERDARLIGDFKLNKRSALTKFSLKFEYLDSNQQQYKNIGVGIHFGQLLDRK